ncbi:DUF861 domain-containing protein [Acidimicrobiaceae bacterium USS-CC1]|uniref:DUF861 domain-containing protein n=1 Tax=Acidiferrimicrobium australe TaxID=2664430 RepID=A0ABW9QTI9_9ACTN|nr:DUF861 domain-containing protein [Acidiferrimicrobium australe]
MSDDASSRTLTDDALRCRLGAPQPAGTGAVGGEPMAASVALAELGDVEVGVWEMTPGVCHDVEGDEVFVVLSGRGAVRFADGSVVDLAPGRVVRLRGGERTVWDVTETLRKVYVALADASAPA